MKRGIFNPNYKNIYLYQPRQYSSVYWKNSRRGSETNKNAKFVCYAVIKTKNYHILKSNIDEAQNFSG